MSVQCLNFQIMDIRLDTKQILEKYLRATADVAFSFSVENKRKIESAGSKGVSYSPVIQKHFLITFWVQVV